MHAAYFKAALPEPCRIFGLRLLVLSLGRYRLLKRFGCAFVSDGPAEATVEDLLLGILICSMRVKEFLEFLDSDRFKPQLTRLGIRIRSETHHDPYFSLIAKFGLFRAYITEASALPDYWDESEEETVSGAHWSQSLEVVLRSELNYTTEEIEEGPLSKALFDFFKFMENQGLIRIMTPEEVEQGKANLAFFEKLAARKEVANGRA